MKQILLMLILFICPYLLYGQDIYGKKAPVLQLDSLKQELKNPHSESDKALILGKICTIYYHINTDSCIYYGQKASELFHEQGKYTLEIFYSGSLGHSYINKGNLPKALEINLNALALADEKNIGNESIGPALEVLGDIYAALADDETALKYYRRLTQLGDVDILGMAFGNYDIANLYENRDQLDSARKYLDKSLELFKKSTRIQKPNLIYGTEYWRIVYPGCFNLYAKVLLKEKRPDLALENLKISLKATRKTQEIYLTIDTYNNLSDVFAALNLKDSSIHYAELAVKESEESSYVKGVLKGSNQLSALYETTNPTKALYYYKMATESEKQMYGSGNIQVIKDIIEKENNRKQDLIDAETAYKSKLRQNILFGSLAALLIVALILYRNNRNKKKANDLLASQKKEIEETLGQLKATQAQLIQSEKMASLGELTAGIAHEIQNPLNFVNNFSEVSEELVKEIKEERCKTKDERNEALEDEILTDIEQNLQKINHHGNRASSIVKGMLEHSRTSSGKKELTDINALADEYLRLSYHGLRAKDKNFNADFETHFDANLPKIEVIPQDIGRVLLNLINNAFQARMEEGTRRKDNGDYSYKPRVTISTQKSSLSLGEGWGEVVVSDNGPGIPDAIKDKIFQPFFTTKDTGKGTGLGLSLAYDIVKAHGGEIELESKENEGTSFTIKLPIA